MDSRLRIELQQPDRLGLALAQPAGGTADYNRLRNRPSVNGVTLEGEHNAGSLYLVSENTTAGWAALPGYQPRRGEIVVYTDHRTVTDELGETHAVPGVKIGDGSAYAVDLPFIDDGLRYEVMQALRDHAGNAAIHVSPAEKEFWNAKLNYGVSEEELILNRN